MVPTDTITALERAAARLIKRDGILAGINLREVAKEAGVTRGLLYHHFGNRTELLRASLLRDSMTRAAEYGVADRKRSLGAWARHWFQTSLEFKRATQLLAVVHLDTAIRGSGESTRIMHMKKESQAALHAIVDETDRVAPGADPVGMQAIMHAIMFGHSVTRHQIAREFRIGVTELDERVSKTVQLLFGSLDSVKDDPGSEASRTDED